MEPSAQAKLEAYQQLKNSLTGIYFLGVGRVEYTKSLIESDGWTAGTQSILLRVEAQWFGSTRHLVYVKKKSGGYCLPYPTASVGERWLIVVYHPDFGASEQDSFALTTPSDQLLNDIYFYSPWSILSNSSPFDGTVSASFVLEQLESMFGPAQPR